MMYLYYINFDIALKKRIKNRNIYVLHATAIS